MYAWLRECEAMGSWRNWRGFLALWGFLFLTYVVSRLAFNLAVHGWIDLRAAAFLDVAVMPFALAFLLWFGFRLYRRIG